METSLLTTKLNIPPVRPQIVPRLRLIERLNESLNFNLVLVSAPAGFGKTTLLSEWVHSNQPEVFPAWVSLDEGDNDPVRFWDYFIAALQTLQAGCGEKILPWLHSSQAPPAESMLTALINELTTIKRDFFIVLDDYHLIESRQIHDGIIYFIEHLPPHIHLVIVSRADPPLPLARFRGRAMMLEIHTDDLRFTQDDTANLLKELKMPGLSAEDLTALNERTEGWVTGLKMAALSMREQKDIPAFIATFTGSQRYIMDYLMEEVLQKQPQEICDFLMKTSILERLNGPLCNALVGREDSRRILLDLEREYLFIMPLDDTRQWYRYEHLFADLLQNECITTYGTEQVIDLHRQASQWFEDNNLPNEAVNHALAARDWERALRLISVLYEERRKRGEYETLIGWLQAIPEEMLRGHIRLYSKYTTLLVATGHLDTTEAALGFLETTNLDDTSKGEVTFARGFIYKSRGDLKHSIELFEKSFTLVPPDDIAMRSRIAHNIAHSRQRLGHFQEVEKWATTACELARQTGDVMIESSAMGQIAIINSYQGKLKRANEIYKKANELIEQTTLAGNQGLLCMNYYFLNDFEAVTENARLAVEMGELTGGKGMSMTGLYYQARVCLVRGDAAEADAVMTRLDEASRSPSIDSTWHAFYIASRVMYAIRRDNLEEAVRWGERLPDLSVMMLSDQPIHARLLLAQGKREPAARILRELYEKFIQLAATGMVIPVRIYQALAAEKKEQALEFLAEALTIAAPEGNIRIFVDEGKLLKPLLEKALTRQITPNFTRKLLDIIEEEEQQRQARLRAAVSSPPDLLSERELEVIKLLADDVGNQRIAEQLCVNLSTVKTHVHHIIEKLEVKDRRQAVQRVKVLKLI